VRSEAERLSSSTSDDDTEVSDSALDAIVGQLQSPSGEVATHTTQALLALCKYGGARGGSAARTTIGKRIILALTSSWNTTITSSSSSEEPISNHHYSTVTVRYASLLVSILTTSSGTVGADDEEDLLQVAIQQSSLDLLLLDVVSSDDPLLQMSILDQIERFATKGLAKMGALRREWLTSSKVVRPLLRLAGGGDGDDDDDGQVEGAGGSMDDDGGDSAMDSAMPHPILGGSALRILSSICKIIPTHDPITTPSSWSSSSSSSAAERVLLTGFHRALRTFARYANGEVERIALVDAISSFASVSEYALTSVLEEEEEEKRMGFGEEEEGVVLRERWLDIGSMPQSKLKALVLCSIARVMDPSSLEEADSNGEDGDGRQRYYVPSSKTSLQLFQCFGQVNTNGNTSPEQLLLNFSKSPFVEVRLGAYELMRAFVSKVKTGATILLSQEGFLEFLLSGEGESVKEGKEARFAIVQAVLNSGTRQLLAENIVKDLERVVSEGPYYVKSVNWQLATEQ